MAEKMAEKFKSKLTVIFWLITIASFFGAIYVLQANLESPHLLAAAPFALEALGALGLSLGWFHSLANGNGEGKIVEFLQWLAGILGAAAIFDGTMRLTRRINMTDSQYWLTLDVIFVTIFVLWMAVSYFINSHYKKSEECDFC